MQEGARHCKALPCSELVVKEERQRDRATALGLLEASCCVGLPSSGPKVQLRWKPKRAEGVGGNSR